MPPKVTSQPMSQNDVLPGKAVTFSVQATGTQPLSYQWQWKQFGRDSEKDGWQNLSGGSGTFQVAEVKACYVGHYQCVVSNCAGSETSQCASLTVGKYALCCSCGYIIKRNTSLYCKSAQELAVRVRACNTNRSM